MSWRKNPNPIVKPPFGSMIDPGHPLAKGLVGCWIFNEHSGLFVNDLSPYRNNGIIYGASWGDGLSFDGSDDYVGCGNAASLNIIDVLTLEVQVNMNSVTRDWQRILWKGSSVDDYPVQYSLLLHGDEVQFRMYKSGSWEYVETVNANLIAGKQYNLKATYNLGDAKVYVDGTQKGNDTLSSSLEGSSDFVHIAAPAHFSSIAGNVSGSNIRKKALSLDEVEWLNAEPYCFIAWPSHRVIFDYGAGGNFYQSVGGIFPSPSGVVTSKLVATMQLSGATPSPTGVITRGISKNLTGEFGSPSGSLVRKIAKVLAGDFPSPSGILNKIAVFVKALAGDSPAQSGVLSSRRIVRQSVLGNFPAAVGAITKKIYKNLTGDLPTAMGAITKKISTSVVGNFPFPVGNVNLVVKKELAGIMGAITGIVSTILNPIPPAVSKICKLIGSGFKKFIG